MNNKTKKDINLDEDIKSIIIFLKNIKKTSLWALGLGEIISIFTASAIASAYYNYDGIYI